MPTNEPGTDKIIVLTLTIDRNHSSAENSLRVPARYRVRVWKIKINNKRPFARPTWNGEQVTRNKNRLGRAQLRRYGEDVFCANVSSFSFVFSARRKNITRIPRCVRELPRRAEARARERVVHGRNANVHWRRCAGTRRRAHHELIHFLRLIGLLLAAELHSGASAPARLCRPVPTPIRQYRSRH